MPDGSFDLIIIGGRPAGASLAARLGQQGLRVLIVDRDTFPSIPSVPSCPLILPHTLALLDEIGIPESAVQASGAHVDQVLLQMGDHFGAIIDLEKAMHADPRRHYFYSIKRAPFDQALWDNLAKFPTVTTRPNFAVTRLLQDQNGRVIGIEGQDKTSKETETYHADGVVGADGRFSFVAQKVDAKITEERTDHNTDFYFSYWQGSQFDLPNAMHTMQVLSTLEGVQYIIFPVANDEVAVGVQMITGSVPMEAAGDVDGYYETRLKAWPRLWHQIQNAKRTSAVWGLKNVGNGYRQAGGPGWVLVGDAAHFKDSIDAQGIYDALAGAKILSGAIARWKSGQQTWQAAIDQYQADLMIETHDMFEQTQARLNREVYAKTPGFIVNTMLRWAMTDPVYQQKFIAYVTRGIAPKGWMSGSLMGGAVVRGIGRDVQRVFRGKSAASANSAT